MLQVQNIAKVFNPGTVNQKTALAGLSLTLEQGEFVTVIGGNGSGKSTLLNCVAGVYALDGGSICIDGENVSRKPEHKRARLIGRVFQDPMLGTAASMGIDENLALARRRGGRRTLKWGISARERAEYRQLLTTLDLGLENRISAKVGLLSGGQRQALTLLMATLHKPRILLLDEHTAALDPKTATKVLGLTQQLIKENGLTALMITHNMRDAITYGERLIMLNEGRIILDIRGEEKRGLTVADLLHRFERVSGLEDVSDTLLLA